MIIAGYTDSWENSIDAVARGEKVIVLVYDSKRPTIRMYNFAENEAKESVGTADGVRRRK